MTGSDKKYLIEQLKSLSVQEQQEIISDLVSNKFAEDEKQWRIEMANGSYINIPNIKLAEHLGMQGSDTFLKKMIIEDYEPRLILSEEEKENLNQDLEKYMPPSILNFSSEEIAEHLRKLEKHSLKLKPPYNIDLQKRNLQIKDYLLKWKYPSFIKDLIIDDISSKLPNSFNIKEMLTELDEEGDLMWMSLFVYFQDGNTYNYRTYRRNHD